MRKLIYALALLFIANVNAFAQTTNPATRAWVTANYCALTGCTMSGAITVADTGGVTFSGGSTLINDGTNTVALKNGTNAQVFRLYGSTGATFGYLGISGSTTFDVWGGSGVVISLGTNNTQQWVINSAGTFISNISNNTSAFDIGVSNGLTLSGSSAVPLINIAQTWSTSGNPILEKSNVTLTSFTGSTTTSRLMSKQVGGVEKFGVDLNGNLTALGDGTFSGRVNPNSSATLTCGSGCSSVTGNPQKFVATTGTAQTSVTVNFGITWSATPVCAIGGGSTASVVDIASVSTTAITFGASVALTATPINVLCF